MKSAVAMLFLASVLAWSGSAAAQDSQVLSLKSSIALPMVKGRIDHYNRIASIPTPPGTQTGLFVPEWGKLFTGVLQQGEKNAEIRVYQAN